MARALLLLLMLCGSHAAAGGATPARLVAGPESIESLVQLPKDLQPGHYEINCQAWVRRQGRTASFTCYHPDSALRAIVGAVAVAGRRAKFVPATRDGVAVAVNMLVMVRLDITAQGPLILAIPNNGVDAARYGPLYTAPQRFNRIFWYEDTGFQERRVMAWLKMHIDEHGKILEYQLTPEPKASQVLIEGVEKRVKSMVFMPGYFDGKPVPMHYVEPVFE